MSIYIFLVTLLISCATYIPICVTLVFFDRTLGIDNAETVNRELPVDIITERYEVHYTLLAIGIVSTATLLYSVIKAYNHAFIKPRVIE